MAAGISLKIFGFFNEINYELLITNYELKTKGYEQAKAMRKQGIKVLISNS